MGTPDRIRRMLSRSRAALSDTITGVAVKRVLRSKSMQIGEDHKFDGRPIISIAGGGSLA